MKFIVPQRLKPGDKVAIVSPSAAGPFLFPHIYQLGLERLRSVFGLEPVEFPSTCQSPEYLSQHPEARAADINAAFADKDIKAIIATTGGMDCMRILPYLDRDIIEANPKIVMGYSDITNIHLFLFSLGIVSYYGSTLMNQFGIHGAMHEYTVNSIKKALFEKEIVLIEPSPMSTDHDFDWSNPELLSSHKPMEKGPEMIWHNVGNHEISGRLWGGCFEILELQFMLNSRGMMPDWADCSDMILYIETSEEMPPAGFLYRFFAALGEQCILDNFKAILVGIPKTRFLGMLPPEGSAQFALNQQNTIKQALKDYDCDVPVIFNLNFGHTDPQIVLPNGGMAHIDGKTKTIRFGY